MSSTVLSCVIIVVGIVVHVAVAFAVVAVVVLVLVVVLFVLLRLLVVVIVLVLVLVVTAAAAAAAAAVLVVARIRAPELGLNSSAVLASQATPQSQTRIHLGLGGGLEGGGAESFASVVESSILVISRRP